MPVKKLSEQRIIYVKRRSVKYTLVEVQSDGDF